MASEVRRSGTIGLAVTESTIVAVQVGQTDSGVEVITCAATQIVRGGEPGADLPDPERLGQALRALWRKAGFKGTAAAVALGPTYYGFRSIKMPAAPERDRRPMVRGELEEATAVPYGQGAFGFLWANPPAGSDASARADIYAYHTSDAAVDTLRAGLLNAGLRLTVIEPAYMALMRAHIALHPGAGPLAFLLPAAHHSDLCVHDGVTVCQVRRIPAGLQDEAQSPGRPTPRKPKMGFGLGLAEDPEPETEAEPESADRESFLPTEVGRSLAFFRREFRDEAQPTELVVLGEADDAARAAQLFAQKIPLPVIAADVPRDAAVSLDPEPIPPHLTLLAVGAAAGAAGAVLGVPVVDISQQEPAARNRNRAPKAILMGAAGAGLWFVAAVVGAISLTVLEVQGLDETTRLSHDISAAKAARAPFLRLYELSVAGRRMRKEAAVPAETIMERVAGSATAGLSLGGLRISADGKVLIEGQAETADAVRRFALAVGTQGVVKTPVIQNMREDGRKLLTFRIGGMFKAPPKPKAPPKEGGQ